MLHVEVGDCREVLRDLPEASVDAVVTDPPYGLEFMGKGWDRGVPGVEFWVEVLRVLKPGGHLLAFGGTRTYHRLACAIEDAGFEVRDCLSWLYGTGFPKSKNLDGEWQGWGTALKPAWEPIVVARKPLVGTVAANVLAHGTGAINVDGCRIGDEQTTTIRSGNSGAHGRYGKDNRVFERLNPPGRWPANVVLDEAAAAQLDEQTGTLKSGARSTKVVRGSEKARGIYNKGWAGDGTQAYPEDVPASEGGASRFFYCSKASKAERGEGNNHPTVKPVALMRWLVRLVTPPGGLVLDPFCGSGTTGVAAKAEGFDFLGVEQSEEYAAIACRRIDSAL